MSAVDDSTVTKNERRVYRILHGKTSQRKLAQQAADIKHRRPSVLLTDFLLLKPTSAKKK